MKQFSKAFKAFFIIMAFFFANLAIDLITGSLVPLIMSLSLSGDPAQYFIYGMLLGQIVKGLIALFFIRSIKVKKLKDYRSVLIGIGTVGFGLIITNLTIYLMQDTQILESALKLLEEAFDGQGPLVFLVVVIGAPIVEEILFRGILFGKLIDVLSPKMAIFLSGAVFGIYHFNIIQTPNTFVMGMVLAYVYYKTGNIKEPILIHLTNNLLAMVPILDQGLMGFPIYLILIVIGVLALRKIYVKH